LNLGQYRLVERSWQTMLWLSLAIWAAGGLAIGGFQARRPLDRLSSVGWWTRLRPFESGGGCYRRWLAVHRWKDRVPDAGTWFGGLSKKRLPPVAHGGWRRFEQECLRAERTHWAMLALVPTFIPWSSAAWFAANLAFGVAINAPCLVIARYNRCRVVRISERVSGVT